MWCPCQASSLCLPSLCVLGSSSISISMYGYKSYMDASIAPRKVANVGRSSADSAQQEVRTLYLHGKKDAYTSANTGKDRVQLMPGWLSQPVKGRHVLTSVKMLVTASLLSLWSIHCLKMLQHVCFAWLVMYSLYKLKALVNGAICTHIQKYVCTPMLWVPWSC